MKSLLFILTSIFCLNSMAVVFTVRLTSNESELMESIVRNHSLPYTTKGTCKKVKFEIVELIRGQQAVEWTLVLADKTYYLTEDEVQGLKKIHERLHVPLERITRSNSRRHVMALGFSCELIPKRWSFSYKD